MKRGLNAFCKKAKIYLRMSEIFSNFARFLCNKVFETEIDIKL